MNKNKPDSLRDLAPAMDVLLRIARHQSPDPNDAYLTLRQLQRVSAKSYNKAELMNALIELKGSGHVQVWRHRPYTGRPSIRLKLTDKALSEIGAMV